MIPAGWTTVTVAELAVAMFDGPFGSALKTSDYTDRGVRVARLENIGRLRFRGELKSFVSPTKAASLQRHILRGGDVLFSSFVDQDTRVCLVPDDLDGRIINKADCFCVRTDRAICEPKFLAYKLAASSSYDTFSEAVRGVTRPRIGLRDLAKFTIELPPLAEQRRIIAKLDALTVRLARARTELDDVGTQVTKYRQAALVRYLAEVTTGVETTKFGDQISLLTSGSRDWAKYYDRGSAVFVLAGNVRPLKFDPTPKRFIDPPLDGADARRSKIGRNDLLVTIVGAGTGDICRIDADYDDYFVCQSVARIKLRSPELSSFYQYWFASEEHGGRDFKAAIYGAARPHLSFDQINGFAVPVVDVQKAMAAVSKIERAFTRAGRLEAEAARSRALLDRLEAAILTKAFRGELVPQDPNDEPASVLLDRIRAQRIAPAQAKHKPRADRRVTA